MDEVHDIYKYIYMRRLYGRMFKECELYCDQKLNGRCCIAGSRFLLQIRTFLYHAFTKFFYN